MSKFSRLSLLIILCGSGSFENLAAEATEYEIPVLNDKTQGCVLNFQDDLNSTTPILLNKYLEVIMPDTETEKITLKKSEEVTFVCSGDSNYFLKPKQPKNVMKIVGYCVQGKTFNIGEEEISIKKIKCNKVPESVLKKIDSSCNGKTHTSAAIGFQIDDTNFLKQIEICFDEDVCKPVYTKHELYPAASVKQKTEKQFNFKNVDSFMFDSLGERPANLYPCSQQKETLSELLGSSKQVAEYNQCDKKVSTQFVKGHLSPNADFPYSFQQNATYYHANAAPQLQFFNNRNWKALEERIRSYAVAVDRVLQIYTGTAEQCTFLPDVNGNCVNISLSPKNKKLPAPLYYWKVVYDKETQSGIGFMGFNVYYDQDPPFFTAPSYESICEENLWFEKSEIELERGLMYCMPVANLLKITGFKDFSEKVSKVLKRNSTRTLRHSPKDLNAVSSSGEIWSLGFKIVFVTILAMY